MVHFFTQAENIADGFITITGGDYNHGVNALHLKKGEPVLVSDEDAVDYSCIVEEIRQPEKQLILKIEAVSEENHELPAEITLYQCLPKSDKLEWIIEKATELGASRIVPVQSKNCVMKLEEKKAEAKLRRWNAIAEAAAKQSKRSEIPVVDAPLSFTEAVKEAESRCDVCVIPYENERGMLSTCQAIIQFEPGKKIAVLIGPEGGFDRMEYKFACDHGFNPISLGKRILRTETAAVCALSLVMIRVEIAASGVMES